MYPEKDAEKAQNKLIATNAGVIQALNNLNVPAFSGGRYATDASLLPQQTTQTQTDEPTTIDNLLTRLTKKQLEGVYNNLFNEKKKFGNTGRERIVSIIKLKQPKLFDVERASNAIYLTEKNVLRFYLVKHIYYSDISPDRHKWGQKVYNFFTTLVFGDTCYYPRD